MRRWLIVWWFITSSTDSLGFASTQIHGPFDSKDTCQAVAMKWGAVKGWSEQIVARCFQPETK